MCVGVCVCVCLFKMCWLERLKDSAGSCAWLCNVCSTMCMQAGIHPCVSVYVYLHAPECSCLCVRSPATQPIISTDSRGGKDERKQEKTRKIIIIVIKKNITRAASVAEPLPPFGYCGYQIRMIPLSYTANMALRWL